MAPFRLMVSNVRHAVQCPFAAACPLADLPGYSRVVANPRARRQPRYWQFGLALEPCLATVAPGAGACVTFLAKPTKVGSRKTVLQVV
jgi:hypothetical protein